MARVVEVQFGLSDKDDWADIIQQCKLSAAQQAALRATLDEVADRCKDIGTAPADKDVKAALGKLDRAFDRLQRLLGSRDVVEALDVVETYGAMGHLISSTAAADLGDEANPEVPVVEIERLIAHKRFRQEPIRQSDLDQLCLLERQRQLNHCTKDAMLAAISHMRDPISTFLRVAGQDKGGNRPRTDREWLIFLLARDAPKIIGEEATGETGGAFFRLCTAVLGACGFDDKGYEDAVSRCLKKHHEWLEWSRLPSLPRETEEQSA